MFARLFLVALLLFGTGTPSAVVHDTTPQKWSEASDVLNKVAVPFNATSLPLSFYFGISQAEAASHGLAQIAALNARSEVSLQPLGGTDEYPFINAVKVSSIWQNNDNQPAGANHLNPDDLTFNGYPVINGVWTTHTGAADSVTLPGQVERPGHYVAAFTGSAKIFFGTGNTNTLITCTGSPTGGSFPTCSNQGCTNFTAKIDNGSGSAGNILTVSSGPTGTGCTLGPGVPISAVTSVTASLWNIGATTITVSNCPAVSAGINITDQRSNTIIGTVSSCSGTTLTLQSAVSVAGYKNDVLIYGTPLLTNFTVPTTITSTGSSCPGGTCYTVDQQPQLVSSQLLVMGLRFEAASTDGSSTHTSWGVTVETMTSQIDNLSIVYNGVGGAGSGDETLYWASAIPCPGFSQSKACVKGVDFANRINTEGNLGILRNMDWMSANASICGLWDDRKPVNLASWASAENRNAPPGTETYLTGQGTIANTIPHPGQYVNAAGTGASGGVVSTSYNTAATVTGYLTPSSAFTASITSNVLNVTSVSSGTLAVGQPITGTNVTVGTYILSLGTGSGGNGTYNLSTTPNVSSEGMTGASAFHVTAVASGTPIVNTQINGAGVTVNNITSAVLATFSGDIATYTTSISQTVASQSGITMTQWDYNISLGSGAPVDKQLILLLPPPVATFTGSTVSGNNSITIASVTGFVAPGVFLNSPSSGGPASNATIIAQVSGTTGGAGVYTMSANASGTVTNANMTATGDLSSSVNLNSTGPVKFFSDLPGAINSGSIPTPNQLYPITYDKDFIAWVSFGSQGSAGIGISCPIPPEVFIELNAELNTTPEMVIPYKAMDAMTDWAWQESTYLKANYTPPKPPIWEVGNELWNFTTPATCWVNAKSQVWIASDTNHAWVNGWFCGSSGQIYGEVGKMASTVAQDLDVSYGAGSYKLAGPVQTAFGGGGIAIELMRTTGYLGQSFAPQSGYNNTRRGRASLTNITVNTYNNTGIAGTSPQGGTSTMNGYESGLAYCYFNYSVSPACQALYASQQATMDIKTGSELTSSCGGINCSPFNVPGVTVYYVQWNAFGQTCGETVRPGDCIMNALSEVMYEGGPNEATTTSDLSQPILSGVNGSVTTTFTPGVTISGSNVAGPNGCVPGMTVQVSFNGGTWSTINGTYVLTAASGPPGTLGGTCSIAANSSSLGTLTGGTITYTGSANYVSFFRQVMYFQTAMATYVTDLYNAAINNGAYDVSQYQLASAGGANPWFAWCGDIYGFCQIASAQMTIASNVATITGTVSGMFRIGDTLVGKNVSGVGTGATSNSVITGYGTCGAGPCGTNINDQLILAQNSTIASAETIIGVTTPTTSGGNYCNPVKWWQAISTWNGSLNGC